MATAVRSQIRQSFCPDVNQKIETSFTRFTQNVPMKPKFLLSFLLFSPVFVAQAQEKPKEIAITEIEKAGPDFLVQGEYEGEIVRGEQTSKYAAQIAALGEGKFRGNFLEGGLPGAGWDGKNLLYLDSETKDGKITFGGKEFFAEINGDVITGTRAPDAKFTLKKVLRRSPTEGAKAPAGAIVLFDGTATGEWNSGEMDERQLLKALSPGGPSTKRDVKNFTLHLEFVLPFQPKAKGQARGNGGVYIQRRYEVQILDSFGFKLDDKKAVGDLCGEIYKQKVPDVSMNYPPLSWQTYDIDFQAAQFEGDKKIKNAVITLRHNGVVVHNNYEITAKTGAGQPEGAEAKSILLQNHGNPVFFRNIWLVEK